MAEPTPGRPGQTGSAPVGARSATAATFVVNDKSLKDLHTTWRNLIKDVKEFNTELQNLSRGTKTVDQLVAKLGQLGIGRSGSGLGGSGGGRLVGMPPVPVSLGSTIPVGNPNYRPPLAGEGGTPRTEGDADPNRPLLAGGSSPWKRRVEYTAAAVGAVSLYYGKRMTDISDADLFFNQQAQNTGGGYQGSEKSGARNAMFGRPGTHGAGGITGYQSVQDALGGARNVFGAVGGSWGNRGMAQLRAAGQLTALTPDMGLTAAGAAVGSLYDPTTSARMSSMGMGPSVGMRGQLQSPQAIYSAIIQRVYRGQKPTAQMITEGLQPGANLYLTLTQGMGLTPDAIEQFSRYAIAQANLGGDAARTNRALAAAAAGKHTADTRLAGLDQSIRSRQNQLGAAQARNTVEAGREGEGALMRGFSDLANVTDRLTATFKNLNKWSHGATGNILSTAGVFGGAATGALNAVGGIGGGMFGYQALKQMWAGRGGPPGVAGPGVGRGLLGRLGGGGAEAAAAEGGGGMLAGAGGAAVPVAVGAAGLAIGYGVGSYINKHRLLGFGTGTSAADDKKMQANERYANDNSLTDAIAGLTSDGYMDIPEAKALWHSEVKPLVEKAIRSRNQNDENIALNSILGLKTRFKTQLTGRHFAAGGVVPGNHSRDDVNIRATPGELVVPRNVVSKHGGASALMRRLGFHGRGKDGHYADGGEVTGKTEGLNASFLGRLKAWAKAEGENFNIVSGYRSYARQQELYNGWLAHKPGYNLAAKPGESNHNYGLAADGPPWVNRHPERFGLRYAVEGENWHVEPINAKSMRGGAAMATGSNAQGNVATSTQTDTAVPSSAPGYVNAPPAASDERSAYAAWLANAGSPYGVNAPPTAQTTPVASGTDATQPTASSGTAPSNPSGNVKLGQQRAAARGWTGSEWDALYNLFQKESGWQTDAANLTSSARGIAQTMMSVHFGKDWKTSKDALNFMRDPSRQIDWGLNYIAQRYTTPSKAWAHSQKFNWYDTGAWSTENETAVLHKDEMVVPAKQARQIRSLLTQRSNQSAMASTGSAGAVRGGGTVQVSISMPVQLVGKATVSDAKHLVTMVKSAMEEDTELAMLGSG